MKQIALKVLGSDKEPLDISIDEGVTAGDVLEAADLKDYILSQRGSSTFLAPQQVVYDLLEDGDMLYASMPACEVY
jgi:hypothetical protein